VNTESKNVILIALVANLGIAAAKFAGAFLTGSASLLAEAVHSVVDSTNQVLLLVGQKKAQRPPSERHPLGHGREAFFWSFVVAILLFTLGGLFALTEGIEKLRHGGEAPSPYIGLAILIVSIGLEGYSFRACLHEVRAQNRYGSLREWFKKTSRADLLVVFMEDLAALLGLVIATIFLLLSWATGEGYWDAIGSIVIGCLLAVVALVLAVEIKSLLVGEAPHTDFRSYMDERVRANFPGGHLFRLIAIESGLDQVVISCKIHPGEVATARELVEKINIVERELKARFPEVKWLFVEPDYYD
jgi:cation diffusion facilitator family transporter